MNTKLVFYSLSTAALLSVAAPAHAEVTGYGRVTYNVVSSDEADDIFFGRHEFAESTIGIKGTKEFGALAIGANVELGINEGVATLLQNGSNTRTRIQEISVAHKTLGTLSLGVGPSVTWIVSDVDQSGTWFSDPLGFSQRFGATRRGPGGESQTPFVQGSSLFHERLRYDSAKFWDGATFHAQLGEAASSEVAFKYNAENGIRFNAWYADYGDGVDELETDENFQANIDGNTTQGFFNAENGAGILAGYKHSSGFNISATTFTADQFGGGDRDLTAIKFGYTRGKHAASISSGAYGGENSVGVDNPDHDRVTIAYNFKPVAGVQFWVQATNGDTEGEEDFNSFAIGGLVKL